MTPQHCPNCAQPLPPRPTGVQTYRTPRRKGGRQVSFARGARILAAFLVDEGYVSSEGRAELIARRWLTRALPVRQRVPRERPADVRRAA